MTVEVHCSRELKVAEEEIDVKGEVEVGVMVEGEGAVEEGVVVKGGVVVEGGVVVKGAAKVEATLAAAAAAVTMMVGKATQELMPFLPFRPTPGVLVALVT